MHLTGTFHIICGHYGCGKTNLSLNLAVDLARQGRKVTLVDLDIVNPYFRSSDYDQVLKRYGIQLIAPLFARTNVDMPALPAQMESVFSMPDRTVIIDVGGDDAGATALGRYSRQIQQLDQVGIYYVINRYRALTTRSEEAASLLKEIESACRLKATGVINNSHVQSLTTAEDVLQSLPFAEETAESLRLPLVMHTCPRPLYTQLSNRVDALYPIDIYVRPPWDAGEQT
ncbi:MAG: ParA family protein [Clostridiales bacterium]|nr:ParA family protein [Clostridiales bacterium]